MSIVTEEYKPVFKEIMILLQKKYNHMTEIATLTGEIDGALQRDDRVSAQMLLGMRQEEIDQIQSCDRSLRLYIESTPQNIRQWIEEAITGTIPQGEQYDLEENTVLRISQSIRSQWEKTIQVDRHVNQRLAGEDSFYIKRKDTE